MTACRIICKLFVPVEYQVQYCMQGRSNIIQSRPIRLGWHNFLMNFRSFTQLSRSVSYYPPKSLALTIPTFAIICFISIPLLYALLNYLSAPRYASRDTLWDGHSRELSTVSDHVEKTRWVYRLVLPAVLQGSKCHFTKTNEPHLALNDRSSVPETCDLDVAVINDECARAMRISWKCKAIGWEGCIGCLEARWLRIA